MTSSSSRRPGEFALIEELFAPLATARGAFRLKDDAATLPARAGKDVVVTTDAIISGVHFLEGDPAASIAQKALRVNLSDLAAKGARAAGYLMALSLPPHIDMKWLRSFASGLESDQAHFGISLFGGDTTATPGPLAIVVTAFGYVARGRMVQRAGAAVGDLIYVTGTIGDGAGGLAVQKGEGRLLSRSVRDHLLHRYRVPQPRNAIGVLLPGFASAALDISDGLVADLGHVARASHVRLVIDAASVPRSAALRALWGDGRGALLRALTGGDDYEIAFTAPPSAGRKVMAAAARSGVPVSQIGRVEKGKEVVLIDGPGAPITPARGGWTHF